MTIALYRYHAITANGTTCIGANSTIFFCSALLVANIIIFSFSDAWIHLAYVNLSISKVMQTI
jgi:hypothetical protein